MISLRGHTVYSLIDPRTREIRYVGFTKNPKRRLITHCYGRRGTHRDNWTSKLKSLGYRPIMKPLCLVEGVKEAQEVEKHLIAVYLRRGVKLVNSTAGGDGVLNPTPEVRRKMSASWTQERKANNPLRGRPRSPEVCLAISKSKQGKPRSEETKHKVGATRKLKFAEGEYDSVYLRNDKGRFTKKEEI